MFLTIVIVAVFLIGYGCIALESGLKINKTATVVDVCNLLVAVYDWLPRLCGRVPCR